MIEDVIIVFLDIDEDFNRGNAEEILFTVPAGNMNALHIL
jgi:hypothetical protein